ncbi:GNAT family N-acetyltransferase [Devosia sp. YIM 151766]|uniref:GNAT family N-acetyltransferase n=1 Tax=Devosia sp. YIM 151766 TaxID=3017325 RepID=UPI00255C7043|nr:GNAT family N-acetyltransferase [Devosia sp. YIM 151766]WIY52602.1 GNAT family N-acetyltransferase [Devosia sp. YIM 151766]
MTRLRTKRLILRQPHGEDAPALAAYLNDFAVAGNLARVPFPYRLADALAWLATRRPDMPADQTNFAIEVDGAYAGQVGFHPGPHGPIIGYWLGQPFWGRGIMSEAAAASLDWFFTASSAPVIYSGVFHFNAASLAIQKKLGFTETGRSSLLCLARGVEVEHIDTQLTQSAWKARRL